MINNQTSVSSTTSISSSTSSSIVRRASRLPVKRAVKHAVAYVRDHAPAPSVCVSRIYENTERPTRDTRDTRDRISDRMICSMPEESCWGIILIAILKCLGIRR